MKTYIIKDVYWVALVLSCTLFFGFYISNAWAETAILVDDYNEGNASVNRVGFSTDGSPGAIGKVTLYAYQYDYFAPPYTDYRETNQAMKFTYNCSSDQVFWYASNLWDGASLSTATDITEFKYLSFRVKGKEGGEDFYIQLQYGEPIADGLAPMTEIYSADYFTVTDEWQQVNIPLEEFYGLDKSTTRAIKIEFHSDLSIVKGELFLDNLAFSKGYDKPESIGAVRIDRKTKSLFVNGERFTIKGVGYQPIPIGKGAYPPVYGYDEYDRDFPLLVNMGCNTIRMWGEPSKGLMDKGGEHGLKIIAGFWMDNRTDYTNPAVCGSIKWRFKKFVERLKDHPALLMWAIGNECNYYCNSKKAYYTLCNELAKIAYQLEGDGYHPVMIVNAKLHHIGVADYNADDMQLNCLDVWGANLYAKDYHAVDWFTKPQNIFEVYKAKSSKPLLITEYGADAFHTTNPRSPIEGYEDEEAQAAWVKQNTIDIMAASDICLGGCVMAYSDEWWKDVSGSNGIHDPGPAACWHGHLPDGYANEEYWGVVSVSDNGDSADIVTPRQAYYELQEVFTQHTVILADF